MSGVYRKACGALVVVIDGEEHQRVKASAKAAEAMLRRVSAEACRWGHSFVDAAREEMRRLTLD